MKIDIRNIGVEKIAHIVFAEPMDCDAYELYLNGECTEIRSEGGLVMIDSKTDALNLIKALQKAIELGNWDE